MIIIIVTAVETSNLTFIFVVDVLLCHVCVALSLCVTAYSSNESANNKIYRFIPVLVKL
jgi:hypothetical protein